MFDERPQERHALMQDPAFAQALRICGQSPVQLPCGLMILHRRIAGLPISMLPRAAPPRDLPHQLRAVGLHRTPLVLSPDRHTRLPRCLKLRGQRNRAIWTLDRSGPERRTRLHPKWRNQLHKAERQGLEITHHRLTPDPDDSVLRLAVAQAQARGYTCWPAPLMAAFARVAPKQTHVFRAILDRTEIAHMLFLSHGQDATYQLGYTTEAGRRTAAHNLLLWRAAQHLAASGILQIDLGLIDGQTPTLDRFKLRTGAASVPTAGTHLYWQPFART